MMYRKLLKALDRQGVDYQLFRETITSLKGDTRCTNGVDIFVNPSEKNLKRIRKAFQSLRGALRICVRPADLQSEKRRVWCLPTQKELRAYVKLSAEDKLTWLEEVNQEICRAKVKRD